MKMKMKIEVEVISEETIKPSSPTPHHLRHHHLSFLDQLAPHAYVPFLYFYSIPNSHNHTQISTHLKKSLSKALTQYYPLAGRVKHNLFVDCNGFGVPFYEARVETLSLSEVLTNPSLHELNNLLPFKLDGFRDIPLGVQLNRFRCGGVAIGLAASHRVADGLSIYTFVKNWAATACGNESVSPDFSAASIFPPRNMDGYNGVSIPKKNDIVTKGFVFDGLKIEALRSKYAESIGLKTKKLPSRVEALSAFLWNKFMAAASKEEESSSTKLYTVVYIMDLRSRFNPPLPQNSFGNYYRAATATPTLVNGEERGGLVRQVIEEIEKIDNKYMRKFQDGYEEHLDFMRRRMERAAKGELVTLTFSSVCRFPLYDADFGWGKPAWVSMAAMKINNQIVFMDTKLGDGIESYFSFKEEDMAKFELDSEFVELISPIGNVKKSPFARL
ncbi:stemmadenine O-acetyltransferase-like [Argentina anserina]|uniref:stemmadenine O-acetyltransferase-like n=1 Tax=Argentina anserina TaxID=57926 RepID=UPI002176498C|nr:stemmadenine O-acetyltransferase-like [Potentilla anserina]